jgi:hypothetical protein
MPTLKSLRSSTLVVSALLAPCLVVSCGGQDASEVDGGNGTGKPGSGTNQQPGLSGVGAAGPGDVDGDGIDDSVQITPESACAQGTTGAAAIPAVVQLVVDTSLSMNWAPGSDQEPRRGQQSKWDITRAALKDAVEQLPSSVALGMSFYPNRADGMPCIDNEIAVPIELLGDAGSAHRTAFNRAIDRQEPNGATPTHAAFMFGSETVAASTIEGRKFVLLITDGVPTRRLDCSGNGRTAVESEPLITAAGEAFGNGVSTFVIGSPGSEDARNALSQIASEGGTATAGCSNDGPNYCHLDMTTAADFGAALAEGLAAVAGRIAACEYAVPEAPDGKTLNFGKVNIIYTKGDGTKQTLAHDGTDMCTSGWVYRENNTKVLLCGAECEAVKADPGAKIDLLLGCDTANGPGPK